MNKIFIDFETYYDDEYSLRKMSMVEYIRDDRFKVLGTSIAINDGDIIFYEGDELPDLDWENSRVVAHNTLFDGLIMVERYGIRAGQWCCTQALLRAFTPLKSVALKNVADLVDVGEKGDALVAGADMADEDLAEYAIQDVRICRALYDWLAPVVPEAEFKVIHITLRWGVEAKLVIDVDAMEAAAEAMEAAKHEALEIVLKEYDLTEAKLASNKQFAAWFTKMGLTAPTKISLKTKLSGPAFAKGDPEWQAYKISEEGLGYFEVWRARESVKSTIGITRPRKMARIARMHKNRTIPMPLKYYGAHTGRWSGTDGYNVQNLPNGSVARTAIKAPKGQVIVVVDSAQIELRINAWFCDERYILDTLQNGKDMYIMAAALHYARPYESFTKSSPERKFGKALTLGSGYGMGWRTFKNYCAAGPLGMDPMWLTDDEAMEAIHGYRTANPKIHAQWGKCEKLIGRMKAADVDQVIELGPLRLMHNMVLLPNDMYIQYSQLAAGKGDQFYYNQTTKLYGPRLQENIVQALARIVIAEQLLAIEEAGILTVSSTHDEILAICPSSEAEATYTKMVELMSESPKWAKDLPLAADGGYDESYCK